MKKAILILSLELLVAAARAQTVVEAWVQRYNGPGDYNDNAARLVVDGIGNVIVTGTSVGTNSLTYYTTIKYSNMGLPLWSNRYDGPGRSEATAIAVDTNGNVFVTGYSSAAGLLNDDDFVTIKYSGLGEPLWTNRYNGPGNGYAYARAIAVDKSGNVFVTGSDTGDSQTDYATIKYSSAGVPLWTNRYNGPRNDADYPTAIVVDNSDDVVVTGSSPSPDGWVDYGTIKYSQAGIPLWTNRYNGPGNDWDQANAVAVDGDGSVFVTGVSHGSGTFEDYATIKYSSAGVPLWTNRYNGPGNLGADLDAAQAIAIDDFGNVFVTGYSGTFGSFDYVTIKYSSTGVPLWTNRYEGPANGADEANSIAVDSRGNVFVTGNSRGNESRDDYATIVYSNEGVPLWTNRYNGPGNYNDKATAIAADRGGNVFVTGYSEGEGSYNDYATIKYSIVQPIPLEFQKMNNQLMLSWTNAAFGLQSAPAITGTFTNVPGATSPYTNPISGSQQFFRLISN